MRPGHPGSLSQLLFYCDQGEELEVGRRVSRQGQG